ncbi:MAG: peptidyl-dipeptidase Dcp, partial [Actinomycetota bacterium]
MSANPFAFKSTLPYEMPDFSAITDASYAPAFEAAMAEHLAEVDAILRAGEPTFENTLVALELAGSHLSRVANVFFSKHSSDTNETIDALYEEYAPKLSAHTDSIVLNPALFARIDAVFQKRSTLGLDPESLWLVERYHRQCVLAGAGLNENDRDKLKALNEELSTLEA